MAAIIYRIFSSSSLVSLGLYHLVGVLRSYLSSRPQEYSAKPWHPLHVASRHLVKNIPLYLLIIYIFIALTHQIIVSAISDPLLKGHTPVHRFISLQSAAVLFLYLILSIALLISRISALFSLPNDLFFAFASAAFFLQFSVSSASAVVQTSILEAKCDYIAARVSVLSSMLCLLLSCQPCIFFAEVALGASICLQGLWMLHTSLFLYVEAFIPEGCHRLLDVVSGVEGSTKCDLEDSRLRAVAILELSFVVYVVFTILIVILTYAIMVKSIGVRRHGSYEALHNLSSSGDSDHIQMKTLAGTQA